MAVQEDAVSEITQAVENLIKSGLEAKTFSTGSKGFFTQGKITVGEGRFQAQVTAVLIGSKGKPRSRVQANVEEMTAALVGLLDGGLPAKTFRTGRTGFLRQGKCEAHGQRFQASVQAVLL